MPITTITVDSVETFKGSGVWEVKGFDSQQHFHTFTSNKPWQAALADRGKLLNRPVTVHSRETRRFGQDIVAITLAEGSAA